MFFSSLHQLLLKSFDRRCRFYDLSKLPHSKRVPRTPLLQLYSSIDNIGNYLPVLGIWQILGRRLDTWCMHKTDIDFEFINKNYKGIIIGGAGLLHSCFEPFWKQLALQCRLPMVVWGVGGCFVDNDPTSVVNCNIAKQVLRRCDYVNFRDDTTANYYNIRHAHISPCPTIAYVEKFKTHINLHKSVLYSSHEDLVPKEDTAAIIKAISDTRSPLLYTDNIQRAKLGLQDIIKRYYCRSWTIVTTRLHGAIIAYGLSIPYIAVPYDEKLRAFHRLYGNGVIANTPDEVAKYLLNDTSYPHCNIKMELVREFGVKVKSWIESL